MRKPSPPISTTVRSAVTLAALRFAFRFCSLVAPDIAIRRAGRMFATPLSSSRRRAVQSPDGGARHEVLRVDGIAVATYAWGDPASEPYVLLAHGWSSHGTRFVRWVEHLRAAGLAVVAFDQPGHGRSGGERSNLPQFARTLRAVADRHGPAAAVIGHSFGGAAIALALADGLPARRAILIAPAADPVDASFRFARLISLPEALCRRMVAGFEAMVGTSFDALQAHRNVPRIGCPALVIHDLEDREVPWAEGERYARYWPASRLLTTRGLGHNRIVDDPGVVAAAMAYLRGERMGEPVVSSPNLPYGFA